MCAFLRCGLKKGHRLFQQYLIQKAPYIKRKRGRVDAVNALWTGFTPAQQRYWADDKVR